MPPPPDIGTLSFAEIERLAAGDTLPPVARWHPDHCGDSGMRIARDGRWFHEGAEIRRPDLVRLFSRILRREADDSHVLVTPYEKLTIAVDDAAFVAIEVCRDGQGPGARLAFGLNTGEVVVADRDRPLRVVDGADGPRPYLHVRGGLDALIARPVYYRLAEHAVENDGVLGVWSRNSFFPLTAAS